MKSKEKPQYSIWQNVRFMVKLAWKKERSVLWGCLIWAALSLGINLSQLFIAPAVLKKVETLAPLPELLGTIGIFALALVVLNGLLGYLEEGILFGRIGLRTAIILDINTKACTTSYPNTRNPEVLKLQEKAMNFCSSNAEPTEHIWSTLSVILLNVAGFTVYLTLLANLNLFLVAVVVVTTAIGFFISKRIHEWGYRHREEDAEYHKKLSYIQGKAESIRLAKDIRIFGLSDWLNDLYEGVLALYEAFVDRSLHLAVCGRCGSELCQKRHRLCVSDQPGIARRTFGGGISALLHRLLRLLRMGDGYSGTVHCPA